MTKQSDLFPKLLILVFYIYFLVRTCHCQFQFDISREKFAHSLSSLVQSYDLKIENIETVDANSRLQRDIYDILKWYTSFAIDIQYSADRCRQDMEFDERIKPTLESLNNINNNNQLVSDSCITNITYALESLLSTTKANSTTSWALQFVDAAAKMPSNILEGNLNWVGAFDQCLGLRAPTTKTQMGFRGKYCTITIGNPNTTDQSFNFKSADINLGICVPEHCSENDTLNLLSFTGIAKFSGGKLALKKSSCYLHREPLDTKAIIVICLLSALGAVLMFATFYDLFVIHPLLESQMPVNVGTTVYSSENEPLLGAEHTNMIEREMNRTSVELSLFATVMQALSVIHNASKLLKTKQSEESLTCIHGIRFISMSWVILGHSLLMSLRMFANPVEIITRILPRFTFQAIANATVSVDTFFLISSILLSYLVMKEMELRGGPRYMNWLKYYLHRWWRLTPPLMLVIALEVSLVSYMSDGPLWSTDDMDPNCNKYWWRNLFYIQTLFPSEKMCMAWSWYLSHDMIFFWLAPLFLAPLFLHTIAGVSVCLMVMAVSFIVTGVMFSHHHYPVDIVGFMDPKTPNIFGWFADIYLKPWCRIGPYIVGILIGYLFFYTGKDIRFTKIQVWLGWFVSTACALSIVYGLYGELHGHTIGAIEAAVYNSLHRTAWAMCVGWLVVACVTGHGGVVNRFLSWRVFIPLSRLTYMAYLIHPIIIAIYTNSQRTPVNIHVTTFSYLFIGNLVVSYAAAFVLTLAFESPMISVEKLIIQRNTEI